MVARPHAEPAPSRPTPPLRIELLGPPRLSWSGAPLHLPRRQSRALLYRLAAAGEPLPREQLAFVLWPESDDAAARRNLVVLLTHLRRALPAGEALRSTAEAIGLDQRLVWCDAADAAGAFAAALRGREIDRLAEAVRRYRGPFAEGFALPASAEFEAWLGRERATWERRYLEALAALAEAHAAQGDHPAAIEAARRYLATDELAEPLHGRLIALYAAAGDRAAAQRQFERCVAVLRAELGVEPRPETRALYEAIRDGAPLPGDAAPARPATGPGLSPSVAGLTVEEPAAGAPAPSPTLPAPSSRLIGRAEEVAAAIAHLDGDEARLLTLCGPGGSGKTRLALEVAWARRERHAGGVVYVSLAALREAHLVLPAIARACGLHESSVPLADLLHAHLRDRDLLLVLDNCEHLPAAAPAVAGLLAAAPRLRVLATSRTVLNLAGEQALHVSPLPLPDLTRLPAPAKLAEQPAVALLLARARAADPTFALGEANAADLAAICVRLDGLPLAIELAAARLKLLSPRALLARLDRRLALLAGGPRDLPDRQQTMRATVEWSYQLLPAPVGRLFARLAVFAGGWTLAAAEQVCAAPEMPGPEVIDGVQALLDAHLIGRGAGHDDEPRFAMLETVREYALERLHGQGDAEPVAAAHTAYFLDLGECAAAGVRGDEAGRWLRLLEDDDANLIAAFDRALAAGPPALALRLAVALGRYWLMRGRLIEGQGRLEAALAAEPTYPPAPSLKGGGAHEYRRHSGLPLPSGRGPGGRSHEPGPGGGSDAVRALAHAAVAELAVPRGDFAAGQAHMRAAVALRRRLNRPRELALALLSASYLERLAGDAAAAAATWAEGEALAAELADDEVTARLAQGKGRDARNTAAADTARRPLEVALAYARRAGDPLLLAHRLLDLVPVTLSTGDGERARAQAEEALTLARRIGHRPATAMALNELGEIARGRGDDEQAARHYIAALRLWREMGNRSDVPRLLHSLAYAALHAGDSARARTLFRRGIDQFREAKVERGVAEGLAGLACVAAVGAQPLAAARLWGAAEALREANGWGMWAADRAEYARYVARAHAAAETPAFAAAWQAGRALTADQALAEAPEDAGAPPDAGAPAAPLPAGAPAGDL